MPTTSQKKIKLLTELEDCKAIIGTDNIPDRAKLVEIPHPSQLTLSYFEDERKINFGKTEGHYLLASGMHTDIFIDMTRGFEYPNIASLISSILQDILAAKNWLTIGNRHEDGAKFRALAGPLGGAKRLGRAFLKYVPVQFISEYYPTKFNSEFQLDDIIYEDGDIITLLIDDVWSTGGSIKAAIKALEKAAIAKTALMQSNKSNYTKRTPYCGFYFIGCVVAVRRVSKNIEPFRRNTVTLPVEAAIHVDAEQWLPNECPYCEYGVPLFKI